MKAIVVRAGNPRLRAAVRYVPLGTASTLVCPVQPLQPYLRVELLTRIRDHVRRRIRHVISSEALILETEHRRLARLPGDSLGTAPREFWQVVVEMLGRNFRLGARHLVRHRGRVTHDADGVRRFMLDAGKREEVDCAGRYLALAVEQPDLLLPEAGWRFPETGSPCRVR